MPRSCYQDQVAPWIFVACLLLGGCRGIEAPYPPEHPPEVAQLLAAASPKLTSIQVPRAKIRQGGGPAANLMLVAQAPARFAGTLQVAGNELVSLTLNEDGYGLRWVGGREGATAMAPGYYSGPPSRCAVETLMGVSLEPETLVDVVLGGAPLIDAPHDIVERSWDRKRGRELLRIQNGRYQQELEFDWAGGQWQFAGASLWTLGADGSTTWLWTIRHDELHTVDGQLLPTKTQIIQPKLNGKGEHVLNVSYQKQLANPPLGGKLSADPPRELIDDTSEDALPPNAGDSWDDDWGDEDGGDGGGDGDEGGGGGDADGGDADGGDGNQGAATGEGGQAGGAVEAEEAEVKAPIPPQFIGNPAGLTQRGDPCAGRP